MRHTIPVVTLLALFVCFVLPVPTQAANQPVVIQTDNGQTEISHLEGGAFLVKKDLSKIRPLVQGEFLTTGDRISTEKNSRIELKLPDESIIRFDEQTSFVLESSGMDKKENKRNIGLGMILGKIWANVSKRLGRRGRFVISSRTAVAGVRGTVYRMNVNRDNSVTVKVYTGEVDVSGKAPADAMQQPPPALQKPSPVAGPRPVAGPHPVSMKEWTFIVRSMQQIDISPDGKPSKPFRFDRDKDLNDWVRFNLKRDQLLKIEHR